MPPAKHSPCESHALPGYPRGMSMGKAAHAAGIGIGIVDDCGRFQEANRLMCRLTGYDENSLFHRSLFELIAPDHLGEGHDMFMQLNLGLCDEFELELRIVRQDSQPVWVHLTGNLIPGTRHIVLTMHDSSDYFELLTEMEN